MEKVRQAFGYLRKFICCQDGKVGVEGPDLQDLQKNDSSEKHIICAQPSTDDVINMGSTDELGIEPEWIKKFFQISLQKKIQRKMST